MFAIAFDLVVADTAGNHPRGVSQAYTDIGGTLAGFGFSRVEGSLYTTPTDDMANLFGAIMAEGVAVVSRIRPGYPGLQGRALVGLHQHHQRSVAELRATPSPFLLKPPA